MREFGCFDRDEMFTCVLLLYSSDQSHFVLMTDTLLGLSRMKGKCFRMFRWILKETTFQFFK